MRSKYGNILVRKNGYTFDSQAECAMYCDLLLLEKAKKVRNVIVHPRFTLLEAYDTLSGKPVKKLEYEADFEFYDIERKRRRVIDCKGYRTDVFEIKEKLFNYFFGEQGLELEYTL
jgi:hypothetical protein